MNFLRLFAVGIVIGMANIMPGVSGGTLAVVFGIYDKFVNSITLNVKKLWANKGFLIPVVSGMAIGILVFSKIIAWLFNNFPYQTNFFFTGIIIGSIPMLYGYATRGTDKNAKPSFSLSTILCFILGLAGMIAFSILTKDSEAIKESISKSALPALTFPLILKLFIAGVVGAVVMIIPGISGSFFMLIMGVYVIIISAISIMISSLNEMSVFMKAVVTLLPNGAGLVVGILLGARLVSMLLARFPKQTYGVILGLIIGSAINIFPGFGESGFIFIASCILCAALGFVTAYFGSKNSEEEKN